MPEIMASTDDSPEEGEEKETAAPAPTPPKRGPGHRGQDVRDTMAEMAAKAHEISLEAGSRMAGTMREVVGAAAGLTVFAIESARDLVQYMVRRGQMSQDEADKLMREVETAHATSPRPLLKVDAPKSEGTKKAAVPVATSPVAPPPLAAIDLEPPFVPPPIKAVAPELMPEAEVAPFSEPEKGANDTEEPATKAAASMNSTPSKPTASVTPAPQAASRPAPANHAPGNHAPAKAAKPVATKAAAKSATKPAAKPAAKPAPKAAAKTGAKAAAKSPAKVAAKAPTKAAAKAPARKVAIPRKK